MQLHDQNIVTFNKSKTEELLQVLRYTIDENDNVIYHKKQVFCSTCGHKINLKNLGGVFPGSRKLCCDTENCLSQYVASIE